MDIKLFQKEVFKMKKGRDRHQFHQPKDLLLGMIEEIGEFRNIIKWEQNNQKIREILVTKADKEKRDEIENFFGDMLWYLGSLADYCNVELEKSMEEIIKELKVRFPIEKAKGSTSNPKTGGYDGKYDRKK